MTNQLFPFILSFLVKEPLKDLRYCSRNDFRQVFRQIAGYRFGLAAMSENGVRNLFITRKWVN